MGINNLCRSDLSNVTRGGSGRASTEPGPDSQSHDLLPDHAEQSSGYIFLTEWRGGEKGEAFRMGGHQLLLP